MNERILPCFLILEVEPTSSIEDVKRAYRELVKVWHPDRFANDPALQKRAQEKLKEINAAFGILEDAFSRAERESHAASQAEAARDASSSPDELWNLGSDYYVGESRPKDYGKALKCYLKAAEAGHRLAEAQIGTMYYCGQGVQEDSHEAAKWWLRAAEHGERQAQFNLGRLLFKGHDIGNVQKVGEWGYGGKFADNSRIEAYKWLHLAVTNGYMDAFTLMQEAFHLLSQTKRNEARRRAMKFYPAYPTRSVNEIFGEWLDAWVEAVLLHGPYNDHFGFGGRYKHEEALVSYMQADMMKRLESLFLERRYDGDKDDWSSAGRMILSRLQGKKPHIQY